MVDAGDPVADPGTASACSLHWVALLKQGQWVIEARLRGY